MAPVDARLYLVSAGPPPVYGIEEGRRVSGGPAFVLNGTEYVIDGAASDSAAIDLITLGNQVWLSTP